ncbi:CRISPR-associated helicase, Cas3 family [Magnetococcus marinus MC-1]|uniref:CRISPR-associated helicase, Cas3 family n=1 Tax=Magnetococcus marinus (strain ATCC BAA-1437 / JCM 17883 / MC-1) TaxID=156889 RepID=A0LDG1_MAGMM|nr:CRISPR-associated helicase/endonuclease Cas3 [Magnetococcus marinus]ABK46004.1 CRISPR-associated helicase, Cas3 family [Magnetococcus marinus MC-1]
MYQPFIAHARQGDHTIQTVDAHLYGVAALARSFAGKVGLPLTGELMGLLHDLGKYSAAFQDYIRSNLGKMDPDGDAPSAPSAKGKVDHSTAGAQLLWDHLLEQPKSPTAQRMLFQIMELCIASHHGGLMDCLTADPNHPTRNAHRQRMEKDKQQTHLPQLLPHVDAPLHQRIQQLLADPQLLESFTARYKSLCRAGSPTVVHFRFGLLTRFLFSSLLDADRLDSAEFEEPKRRDNRLSLGSAQWPALIQRLEAELCSYDRTSAVNAIRHTIADHCQSAANRPRGTYTLTVPTGGGKTLASLRFALHHAQQHKMDHIFYIIPFTTIIDQNAQTIRRILEPHPLPEGSVVLEHHSNLSEERLTWQNKLASENWDRPVVLTTMVQFLETLFGGGTRGARRMHHLANSVLIFDEIQALPLKCTHLFNNAINFLQQQCGATVLLCSATQPHLHCVNETKGAIQREANHELMPNAQQLFKDLKRVQVKSHLHAGELSLTAIAQLAQTEQQRAGSCLVVVNTKKQSRALFQLCQKSGVDGLYHLSTDMCQHHRKTIFKEIRQRLDTQQPTLCISTQLIEAGVDVDFDGVIRFAAGLDSIAQAAGRCNRHGKRPMGTLHVVMPTQAQENLSRLKEIETAKKDFQRMDKEMQNDPADLEHDLLTLKAMERYYTYKYGHYNNSMYEYLSYIIDRRQVGRDDTLLSILSDHEKANIKGEATHQDDKKTVLRQAFKQAGQIFQAIDAPTRSLLVPHAEGRSIIQQLCGWEGDYRELKKWLRQAQPYTVNLYPYTWDLLLKERSIAQTQEDSGIWYLINDAYYSDDFGLFYEPHGEKEILDV